MAQLMGNGVTKRFRIGQRRINHDGCVINELVAAKTERAELCRVTFGFVENRSP
jgi:hypothetical protein